MPGPFADEQLTAFVAQPSPPFAQLDVAAIREGIAQRARERSRGPEMQAVHELRIGALPARVYRPAAGRIPLVVYLHGGGWTIGNLESHDRMCRRLADGRVPRSSRSTTGSRLSTRGRRRSTTPLPHCAGWPRRQGSSGQAPSAVAVAGDSAGGTLAALACLRLRDEYPAALPRLQALLYANTDLTGTQPSMREKATGWGLDASTVRFFNSQWVPDQARWSDPGVSPLHAPDLSGLPGALIVTAEHDPLRDESEAYARRLRDAGVEVELRREPGLIHNFMLLDEISPACAAAADRVAADLRAHLNAP